MEIVVKGGLPYVTVQLIYRGRSMVVDNVLIDTGSASTVFQADLLLETGLFLEPTDVIREIRGVGGRNSSSPSDSTS